MTSFLQISDLHFGEIDPQTGDSVTDSTVQALAMTWELWQGCIGHHARGLRELDAYLKGLRANQEHINLIVTGDYSVCGGIKELEIAYHYIYSRIDLQPPRQFLAGLQMGAHGAGQVIGLPGNHDHWGGLNSPFSPLSSDFPASLFKNNIPLFPYLQPGPQVGNRNILFIGVSSDADVIPGTPKRWLAHGDFVSQLNALAGHPQLGPNPNRELRILVIHHALHHKGKFLRVTKASAAALKAFLTTNGIQVMLTGHTHRPHFGTVASAVPVPTHELCCGSTTQIDSPPSGWLNLHNQTPSVKFARNSLLMHRLQPHGPQTLWTTDVVTRDRLNGFQTAHSFSFVA
jgi:hypothetical protein